MHAEAPLRRAGRHLRKEMCNVGSEGLTRGTSLEEAYLGDRARGGLVGEPSWRGLTRGTELEVGEERKC